MIQKPLTFVATSDVAGQVRGKSFPSDQMDSRIKKGVGWTPTNVMITCFDTIADSPYGSFGDLALIPDESTRVQLDYQDGTPAEDFMIGTIRHLDGTAWECCTRSILQKALNTLYQATGITVKGAFEHEFQLQNPDAILGGAYSHRDFRRYRHFGRALMQAVENAGVTPDTFMKEYGVNQFEITNAPATGCRIADEATILREITYGTAERFDNTATFTPISDPNHVGNGVHIHLSFIDDDGNPLTYDANDPYGMSEITGQFIAGVLKYLPAIVALTAPSKISYDRLTPHRWSAAYNNLGFRDREASVRICPINNLSDTDTAKQYNFEIRAVDAAASPYLAMASVVFAGVQGIKDTLPKPKVTEQDLSLLSAAELTQRGYTRLPETLQDALQVMQNTPQVTEWLGQQFIDVYMAHKQGELNALTDKSPEQVYEMYRSVY